MACGTPTIASNVTSIPEVLGDDAVYIDPQDVNDISKKLLNLIEDKDFHLQMSFKGLRRSSMYSWKRTAVETIQVLTKLGGK
jgi:glycosyltransferase involved in cell wall biosynthesis